MLELVRRPPGAPPRVVDGAVGTELIARGLDLAVEPPEAWNLGRPDDVRAVHAAYAKAGAAWIQTNTFGGNRARLARAGLDGKLAEVNRRAVAIARAAAGTIPVVASVGPTGIDASGPGAADAIARAYDEQLRALAAAGIDAVHLETLYDPVEAAVAVRACRVAAPGVPVILSATFGLGDTGFVTPWGVPWGDMLRAMLAAEPDAVGVNCSLEGRKMAGLVAEVRARTALPLVARPQGGPTSIDCRAPRRRLGPVAEFVRGALAVAAAGADYVGGCCGAGPACIEALVEALATG